MQRFVRSAALPALVLVLAGCADSLGPPSTVAEARALWVSHNLHTYSYFGTRASFAGASGVVRVDVSNGSVVAVTDMTTHAAVATAGWLTVDQLLDLAETMQPHRVQFDRSLGYPTRVERCCMADDSGTTYTVSSLYLIPLSF